MKKLAADNASIADQLEHVADVLSLLDKNPFRIRSYRRAAQTVRQNPTPVADRLEEKGLEGLQELSGIGAHLAHSIQQIVQSGRPRVLDDLEAELAPEALLTRVPGIGPKRARKIHDKLHIDTLEELELAAHDGRLEGIEGLGTQTVQGVRDALAGILTRSARRRATQRRSNRSDRAERPDVETLLDVDTDYRKKADAGELRTIAPRRFNPEGEAWLPVMKTRRNGWSFRVLFSNTARAHELDKTRDWVVIYYEKNGTEGQCTVITAGSGPMKGQRIVRGREPECREYYGMTAEQ